VLSLTRNWILTFAAALTAVVLGACGLLLTTFDPGAAPAVASALLAGSLACTGAAFVRVALRVRRLELENEGLIEEISQEFDRVRDKLDIFAEAQASAASSEQAEAAERSGIRRVMVK